MLKRILSLIPFLVSAGTLFCQQPDSTRVGIHQSQNEYYSTFKSAEQNADAEGSMFPQNLVPGADRHLTRKVLGWHPYWVSSTAYQTYDYTTLSHIAYFSYEVDTATGGFSSVHDWYTTPIISYAHERGTKVLLTVTNFGTARNTELLSDTIKQKYLINNLITLLKNRNGDGVNFDLESVAVTQRANLVSFISRAVTMIKAQLPAAEISMATPAVDWSGSWDFKALSELCDYLVFMGYDYYWKGSTTAGPVAPLQGENYNVTRTITTYLATGVAPAKLMLGVPWYGYDWPVVNSNRKAASTGTATSRLYSAAIQLAENNGYIFDNTTSVPYSTYKVSAQWRQMWYDDLQSLGMKYELVNQKALAGIGIWALSYEGSDKMMWTKISSAFSSWETSADSVIKVYPNPVSSSFTIDYVLTQKENVAMFIYDSRGRKIITVIDAERDSGFNSETVSMEGIGSGVYFVTIRTGDSVITRKIVVIKQ
jgi:spore germination protein YaaH